ncbi:hypothetical protein ACMA5I_11085 [Paracoccaceae bacterium GXU_MW_L88]
MRLLLSLLIALSLPAFAQERPSEDEIIANATDIPPEEWRELTEGNVVTYYDSEGEFFANEYYEEDDSVRIHLSGSFCMNGSWTDWEGLYCFSWERGEPSCFRHVRYEDEIYVIDDEAEPGEKVQSVTRIGPLPYGCTVMQGA